MGSGITSLFGGGGYEAPAPVKNDPVPARGAVDPEEKDVRDAERRKLRAKANGVNGTLLKTGSTLGAASLLGNTQGQ